MNTKIKQRIIGGLVLFAILAIFLPVIFHGSKPASTLRLSAQIPKAPPPPDVQLQTPSQTLAVNQFATAQVNVQPAQVARTALQAHTTLPTTRLQRQAKTQQSKAIQSASKQQAKVESDAIDEAAMHKQEIAVAEKLTKSEMHNAQAQLKRQMKILETLKKNKKLPKKKQTVSAEVLIKNKFQRPVPLPPATQKTKASSVKMPKAWVVQLAAFSSTKNAKRLVKKLRQGGFDAYMRVRLQSSNKVLVRVYVGPEIKRVRAQQLLKQLQAKFKLNGVVRKYTL